MRVAEPKASTRDMAVSLEQGEQQARAAAPRLLYVSDFPPSGHHGGAILVHRLLNRHPIDRLTVITSKSGMAISGPTGLLKCPHIALRSFGSFQDMGIRAVARAIGIAIVTLRVILELSRDKSEALITIIEGHYYFACAMAAWATGKPYIAFVHDNFVSGTMSASNLLKRLIHSLNVRVLRGASHIYCVGPGMQLLILKESGMNSEIQLPSTTTRPGCAEEERDSGAQSLVVLFAGTMGYTVRDSVDLLVHLITRGQLRSPEMPDIQLHLCTDMTDAEVHRCGWNHKKIVNRGWISQPELPKALSSADILFLPYSFLESSRAAVETAFPSKAADYLIAGRPILVFGPKYSSVVRYASEQGFAEIVDEFNPEALARGISKIAVSPDYQKRLVSRAREVFSAKHDIRPQQEQFYSTLEKIIARPRKSARPTA